MPKKHILDIDEETWKNVLKYKIDSFLPNNNEAVLKLIKKGLQSNESREENSKETTSIK